MLRMMMVFQMCFRHSSRRLVALSFSFVVVKCLRCYCKKKRHTHTKKRVYSHMCQFDQHIVVYKSYERFFDLC